MREFVILIFAVVPVLLGSAYYAYRATFFASTDKKQQEYAPALTGSDIEKKEVLYFGIQRLHELPFEPVIIHSVDQKKLFGRYYHNLDGAPLQIQFHGYRGSAMRDFCSGSAFAKKMGHNVLVVDQRSHGYSEGNTITLGVMERYDCQSWANYAYYRFGNNTPLILTGVSMGATTVLMASDLDLPETVCGIVADCPYSSPIDIITKVAGEFGLPRKPAAALCGLGAWLYGHFRVSSASALESVRKTHLPIILLHGEEDQLVPCHMSREIYDACAAQKELHTFPGASHGMCYWEDPQRYEAVVGDFLRRCLNRTEN